MKISVYVVSGLVALSAGMTAMSQESEDQERSGRGFMAAADTNGNGEIDKSEFTAMQEKRFSETDQNGDGISFEEYEAKVAADRAAWQARREEMRAQKEAERAEKRAERTKKRFERLDADGNGTVTAEEYRAAADEMFDRMDRNDDGILNDRRRGKGKRHRHGHDRSE